MADRYIKEPIITKEPIIGFLVTKHKSADKTNHISVKTISMNSKGRVDNKDSGIPPDGEIVAILPAVPESYKVFGSYAPNDEPIELGYEFKGVNHTEWVTELRIQYEKYWH